MAVCAIPSDDFKSAFQSLLTPDVRRCLEIRCYGLILKPCSRYRALRLRLCQADRVTCCAAPTVAKTGSNAGSIDTPHASFGNAAIASLQEPTMQQAPQQPEAFSEELAAQLLEKYKLWQQQISSLVASVSCSPLFCTIQKPLAHRLAKHLANRPEAFLSPDSRALHQPRFSG